MNYIMFCAFFETFIRDVLVFVGYLFFFEILMNGVLFCFIFRESIFRVDIFRLFLF